MCIFAFFHEVFLTVMIQYICSKRLIWEHWFQEMANKKSRHEILYLNFKNPRLERQDNNIPKYIIADDSVSLKPRTRVQNLAPFQRNFGKL